MSDSDLAIADKQAQIYEISSKVQHEFVFSDYPGEGTLDTPTISQLIPVPGS